MAALMAAVVVPAAASRVIGMVMRGSVVVPAVSVRRRGSRAFIVLRAAQRMRHCRQALKRDQQQEREEHEFSEGTGHFGESKGVRCVDQGKDRSSTISFPAPGTTI